MRSDLRFHGTQLLRPLCRQCHSAMSTQLFSTKGICSTRSSMVLVGKHVHLYCWCWHTEHILIMMVIPGICQTDSAGLSNCLSYGAYLNTKWHPWKISPVQTCTLPKQGLFHFLVEKELMWPWCWCSWIFLQIVQSNPRDDHDKYVLSAMHKLVQGTLNFLGVMHSHDLWLPHGCAGYMMKQGMCALRAYSFCGRVAMEQDRKRLFCMRPKFHYWAHTIFEMKRSYEDSHPQTLSPAIFNCEMNEDFIGKVSRISRHVSPRLTILRTLQRYGVAFQARLRRMNAQKRKG